MKSRRELIALLAAAATLMTAPRSARAQGMPVIDIASIGQIATEAGLMAQQLATAVQQVEALRNAARQLDPRSYLSVQNILAGNGVSYDALLRDVRSMGYSLEQVNARYHALFPDEQAVRALTPAQFEATHRDMNRELYDASLVAARSQSTLRSIEDNNAEARNILDRSEGNESQVAQLQSALQMLGLIHQNLVAITQMVSASGRVTSNTAARAATQRRIEREQGQRAMRDYVKDEPIPDIDSRFLQRGSW